MKLTRALLLTLLLSAPAHAAEAADDEAPRPAAASSDEVAELKEQVADLTELSSSMRGQIETTIDERDRYRAEAEALRQQLTAAQSQGSGEAATLRATLESTQQQLSSVTAAREELSRDARALAGQLAQTRGDRDRYQRQAMEAGERSRLLQEDLAACASGARR